MAGTVVNRASAASRGAPTSRSRCSRGEGTTGLPDPTRLHRRTRGRPMAPDPSGIRPDERAGASVHGRCSCWTTTPSSSLHRHEDSPPAPTQTISTPSRRSAAVRDRRALTISHSSPSSGKGMRAFIGIRRPISSRARTTCRCRRATGSSRCSTLRWRIPRSPRGAASDSTARTRAEVTWRPVTAIPLADTDGNPDTVADPDLATAHQHPIAPGIPGGTSQPKWRRRNSAAQSLRRCADLHSHNRGSEPHLRRASPERASDGNNGRVWGGMHFPSTVAISDAEGAAIATYMSQNAMKRVR